MIKTRWIVTAAVAFAAVGVVAWAAQAYGTRYCTALKAANLLREVKDRTPIDCAEFWINRYQAAGTTVLSTFAAIAAAWVAWSAAQRQIRQQSRSNEFAETTFWQQRASEIESQIDQLRIAQEIATAVIVTEYDARLGGDTGNFEHRAFANQLLRGGFLPFQTINPTGIQAIAYDFNRLTSAIDRIARAQKDSLLLLDEFEDAFNQIVTLQSDVLTFLGRKERDLEKAQILIDSLAKNQIG